MESFGDFWEVSIKIYQDLINCCNILILFASYFYFALTLFRI